MTPVEGDEPKWKNAQRRNPPTRACLSPGGLSPHTGGQKEETPRSRLGEILVTAVLTYTVVKFHGGETDKRQE